MTSPTPNPVPGSRSLGEWLLRLGPAQVPVDAQVRDAALEEIAGQRGSAASLAQRLLADPALVLLLFRAANRALARYDRTVYTLEHAISLLGNRRIQTLLTEAPVLAADHPHATDFRQALLRSAHAAWQARLWAEGSGRWQPEEVFWSTLLATAPLWPLWLEQESPLRRLEQLRAHQGAVSIAQQREALGCLLADLGAALGEYWLLPENSRLCWHKATAGSARQWLALARAARLDDAPVMTEKGLREIGHHPALVIALANALALESDWDWYSARSERLLRIAASSCRRSLATLISHCHRTAAELSQFWGDGDLLTPGTRLLGRWREAAFRAPPPEPEAAPASSETGVLASALQRLRLPGAIANPRDALELMVTTLRDGLGLTRVAALPRSAAGELSCGPARGFAPDASLHRFRHLPTPNSLLGQMLAKPVCLLVSDDNRARFWPHLPATLRGAISERAFLLMSIFAGGRPLALIYADTGAGGPPPDARQQQLFKQLCRQLSLSLERIDA